LNCRTTTGGDWRPRVIGARDARRFRSCFPWFAAELLDAHGANGREGSATNCVSRSSASRKLSIRAAITPSSFSVQGCISLDAPRDDRSLEHLSLSIRSPLSSIFDSLAGLQNPQAVIFSGPVVFDPVGNVNPTYDTCRSLGARGFPALEVPEQSQSGARNVAPRGSYGRRPQRRNRNRAGGSSSADPRRV
jgi:hypothetical protein